MRGGTGALFLIVFFTTDLLAQTRKDSAATAADTSKSRLSRPDTLGQVTVVGKRPLIEQKVDRMVLNVDAAVTNVGATALEVLEKAPGVKVDKDGNISLKGKQGVLVMMDGKPTYLAPADLAPTCSAV